MKKLRIHKSLKILSFVLLYIGLSNFILGVNSDPTHVFEHLYVFLYSCSASMTTFLIDFASKRNMPATHNLILIAHVSVLLFSYLLFSFSFSQIGTIVRFLLISLIGLYFLSIFRKKYRFYESISLALLVFLTMSFLYELPHSLIRIIMRQTILTPYFVKSFLTVFNGVFLLPMLLLYDFFHRLFIPRKFLFIGVVFSVLSAFCELRIIKPESPLYNMVSIQAFRIIWAIIYAHFIKKLISEEI